MCFFWGYLVAIISLLVFILLIIFHGDIRYSAYYLWFMMILGYPFHYRLIKKSEQDRLVMTYIEKLMAWVWSAFAVSIIVVVLGLLVGSIIVLPAFCDVEAGHEFLRWFQWLFITPFMLCLYGFALFVSGKAYGFKPLVTGGVICWIATFVLLFAIHNEHVLIIQQAVLCISATAGFIIPGHMLNCKARKNV